MTLVIQKPTGASLVIEKPIGSKVLLTAKQYIPAVIGEPFGGGYFAGYISHTADGNPTHALIVAPRGGIEPGATGTGYTLTTNYVWKTSNTSTSGTSSVFDGRLNTDNIIAAGINDHPAAKFCVDLSIGGFTDWYLPAVAEAEIAYFNLKPTTQGNNTTSTFGINAYAVPPRISNYTSAYPSETFVSLFNSTGAERFEAVRHWVSNTASPTTAQELWFNTGLYVDQPKSLNQSIRTRAFRRIAL